MNNKQIYWNPEQTPQELHLLLHTLGEEYQIASQPTSGLSISFVKSEIFGQSTVSISANQAVITYNQPQHAARAVGSLLAGIAIEEQGEFKTLGIMLDCSRNAVMKVSYLKKWLRQLALLGYNMVMLYTEETYQLPDEPQFGYLRGGYSLTELKELDDYAGRLGIEMVACIQTLGHLEQLLQWDKYATTIRDTSNILLVDEPQSYRLIDKMLTFWSEALSSRRIHVGMDEAHDLGRGKFMDQYGYEDSFEIFNRHLAKVVECCNNHGYATPMIWSDMYFRMSNKNHNYYDLASTIPHEVKEKIPQNIELVYWDYYHRDREFYIEWIQRHQQLGFKPLMAAGIFTWGRFWYEHYITKVALEPAIQACRQEQVDELLLTLWGDDGAYCEFDSAWAGLCYGAELSYNSKVDDELIAARFGAICHADYHAYCQAGSIQSRTKDRHGRFVAPPAILWDDPLYAIAERSHGAEAASMMAKMTQEWRELKNKLELAVDNECDSLDHAIIILDTLLAKINYRQQLINAYSSQDKTALQQIAEELTTQIIEQLNTLLASFRVQWMKRNKPFGFEVIQLRFGGLLARYQEVRMRINELLDGKIDTIAELDIEYMPDGYNCAPRYSNVAMPQSSTRF